MRQSWMVEIKRLVLNLAKCGLSKKMDEEDDMPYRMSSSPLLLQWVIALSFDANSSQCLTCSIVVMMSIWKCSIGFEHLSIKRMNLELRDKKEKPH
ncbi:hypothetical protein IEQ34_012265 [Dendrobium chrysotoxum]|uniref:Uncharacterized protein n=1 Tax=Dendrobium chrysotoxum TaxID=161865 RepID=A0AAV7GS07_DENCH|nr:hypothetical protein IEQ34_012265 [Dendrobium chrysotoxum]